MAVEGRIGDPGDEIVETGQQHGREPQPEEIVRIPPVEHAVRHARLQCAAHAVAPNRARPPDDVADDVVRAQPERGRQRPPRGHVERAHPAVEHGHDDVDDVAGPQDDQENVQRPDELGIFPPLGAADDDGEDAQQEPEIPAPGGPDGQPFAPDGAQPGEAWNHVEEGAPVHHGEPGEDDAVDMQRTDAAEDQPRHAAEDVGADQFQRQDQAEEIDDGQPEDGTVQPYLGRGIAVFLHGLADAGGAFAR